MEMDPRGPVTQLFVVDDAGHPVGVIHIHDIIREGLQIGRPPGTGRHLSGIVIIS